jgi:hypothetical protein
MPAKAAVPDRLYELVHDVLITAVSASGGVIPIKQEMRNVVRACRECVSEIDAPTEAPRKKVIHGDPETEGAELAAEDELADAGMGD